MTLFRGKYRIESLRRSDWDYRNPSWYFVTICTKGSKDPFGEVRGSTVGLSAVGTEASAQWQQIPAHHRGRVRLDHYVIMPNHLHGIIILEGRHAFSPDDESTMLTKPFRATFKPPEGGSLGSIIRSYKAGISHWSRKNGVEGFSWQPRYYEHIIRNNRSVDAIREYMRLNPQNWVEEGRRWRFAYQDVASYVSTSHWNVLYNL